VLADLRTDMGREEDDTHDDEQLAQVLAASISFVQRIHLGRYDFGRDLDSEIDKPLPDADMILGACRLAARWHTRRRSPDALVAMGELGSGRVPSFDVDIDRMLRIGRFAPSVFA
jgi:hypothetical protein